MLFASTELAARLERADARLMGDAARAALRRRQGAGCFELPIAGGVATYTALLQARLEIASRAGCDIAVVTTQPGSKSQENVQKRGFELLYTRAILVHEV